MFAGLVGMERARPGALRFYIGMAGVCAAIGLLALISCGGLSSNTTTTTPVTVNPGLATLFASESGNSWPTGENQQQFTANQSVTWAVAAGSGTVSPTGLYLPPQTVPNPATVTVSATPATGSAASAFVTVAAPTVLGTAQITVTATAAGGAAHGDGVSLTVQ
jgi:hypothetical protein